MALALVFVGEPSWLARAHRRVAALTIGFGAACTVFSEWLNVVVRQTWAYSDLMPVVLVIGTAFAAAAGGAVATSATGWPRRTS